MKKRTFLVFLCLCLILTLLPLAAAAEPAVAEELEISISGTGYPLDGGELTMDEGMQKLYNEITELKKSIAALKEDL